MKKPRAAAQGRWRTVGAGTAVPIDWAAALGGQRPVDPYLVWADVSGYAGFGSLRPGAAGHDGLLPVLVELLPGDYALEPGPGTVDPAGTVDPVFALLEIPAVYKQRVRRGTPLKLVAPHFTARVQAARLPEVLASPIVRRVQLGVPRVPEGPDPRRLERRLLPDSGLRRRLRTVIGIVDDGCAWAHPAFCEPDGRTRVHFLWDQNRRVADGAWETALLPLGYGAELWHDTLSAAAMAGVAEDDQLAPYTRLDYGPVAPGLDGRGTSFTQPAAAPGLPPGQRVPAEAMLSAVHGTGVMHLVAGVLPKPEAPHPLDGQRALGPELDTAAGQPAQRDDAAAEWPIVFVQLPTRTTLDTSGGSLAVHVLDAVHYILHRAERLPWDQGEGRSGARNGAQRPGPDDEIETVYPDNRVVVNVSFGAMAGSHDGTSILELALAALVAQPERSRWISLAAGNAHAQRTHARLTLAEGEGGSFEWTVGPDNPLQSFLEVWLPDVDAAGYALAEGRAGRLRVTAFPPRGRGQALTVGRGHVLADDRDAAPWAGVFHARSVVQGLRGTMVLLAVARTRAPLAGEEDGLPVAPHGRWQVQVQRVGARGRRRGSPIDIHAWAERNDLLYGNLRAQQSHVVTEVPVPEPTEYMPTARALLRPRDFAQATDPANPLLPRYAYGSVSGLASTGGARAASGFLAAAACRLADGEIAPYSSGGPYRQFNPALRDPGAPDDAEAEPYKSLRAAPRQQADVAAPADIGTALRGLRVAGTRVAGAARLSGTSAAAPLAARELAGRLHDGGVGAVPQDLPPDLEPSASRPTPTPGADDLYRRGVRRLR